MILTNKKRALKRGVREINHQYEKLPDEDIERIDQVSIFAEGQIFLTLSQFWNNQNIQGLAYLNLPSKNKYSTSGW